MPMVEYHLLDPVLVVSNWFVKKTKQKRNFFLPKGSKSGQQIFLVHQKRVNSTQAFIFFFARDAKDKRDWENTI